MLSKRFGPYALWKFCSNGICGPTEGWQRMTNECVGRSAPLFPALIDVLFKNTQKSLKNWIESYNA